MGLISAGQSHVGWRRQKTSAGLETLGGPFEEATVSGRALFEGAELPGADSASPAPAVPAVWRRTARLPARMGRKLRNDSRKASNTSATRVKRKMDPDGTGAESSSAAGPFPPKPPLRYAGSSPISSVDQARFGAPLKGIVAKRPRGFLLPEMGAAGRGRELCISRSLTSTPELRSNGCDFDSIFDKGVNM